MNVSIVIPVFNEGTTLPDIVAAVSRAAPEYEKEIIVVNDGSTDQTAAILASLQSMYGLVVVNRASNGGKGAALRDGFGRATGDIILIQDGDLEYSPEDYSIIFAAFDEGVDAVYGVRTYKPAGHGYWSYIAGAALIDLVVRLLYAATVRDVYTGYKAFRKNVVAQLNVQSTGFEVEAEITCKLLRKNLTIAEVPIHYYPRSISQGKKIRPIDACKGLWTIVKYRFIK